MNEIDPKDFDDVKSCIVKAKINIQEAMGEIDKIWPVDDSVVKTSLALYDAIDELDSIMNMVLKQERET